MKQYGSTCLLLVASIAAIVAEPVYENTFCMQRKCPYEGYFRCKSTGHCLYPGNVCDGYNNCPDGSDEEKCGVPNFGCNGYLCDNRSHCVSYGSVCNGYSSCLDKSDEGNCLQWKCPYNGDFKCNDGKCLRSYDICNGYDECQSGEDEQNCDSKPCRYDGDFRCADGLCIRARNVCNRYNNCRDGSDEINCSYDCPYKGDINCNSRCYRLYQFCERYQRCFSNTTTNCSNIPCPYDGDFRCPKRGGCIRSYRVCDGYDDCYYGEDEQNCTSVNCRYSGYLWCSESDACHYKSTYCRRTRYYNCEYTCSSTCANSTRLSRYIVNCDGINDCADESDENNCYNTSCPTVNDFRCKSTGACIPQTRICDGVKHCSDGSDEFNCSLIPCPYPGDVKCRDNGSCIHSDMICNGRNDCTDGSDEKECASRPCPYLDDVRCNDSQACIRADRWCDQRQDCMDGSDEENCYDIPCPYAGDFRCAYNGYCIRNFRVCDGREHCLDGSDEGMNYCPETFTMGMHWERTLTKTTNTHKCSDIHPSFKLTDVITRECLRNRTWAPINMSQCVMNSDSPIVMIVTVILDTINVSLVKSNQDVIMQEMKRMIIEQPPVHVETVQSVKTANVAMRITYEFSTLTTTELIENIKDDMNVTTLGNISVTNALNLTVFELTDICQCPDSVSSSTLPTGANDTESIVIVSVCSGKPCQYNSSNFTYQCAAPFVGDGKMCGKDSDEDGYPDMALKCNDTHCIQDSCPTVYNPNQNLEVCNDTQGTSAKLEDDELSTSTTVGVTLIITLIFSIFWTLLIVFIVYKIMKTKQSTTKNEITATSPIVTDASLPKDSTIKGNTSGCHDENYEYPEDFNCGKDSIRYQSNPGASLQMNPAYNVEKFDGNNNAPVYENLK